MTHACPNCTAAIEPPPLEAAVAGPACRVSSLRECPACKALVRFQTFQGWERWYLYDWRRDWQAPISHGGPERIAFVERAPAASPAALAGNALAQSMLRSMPPGISGKTPRRLYHRAAQCDDKGNVSALCFRTPRAIDMTRETWTTDDSAVTCPKCKAAIAKAAS